MSEHDEQVSFMNWAEMKSIQVPQLELLFAVPNGGLRDRRVAWKLKQEGLKPGVPDLFLPVARQNFHGLFIEMKTETGRMSPEQKWWQKRLFLEGNQSLVCRGWEQAARVVCDYMGVKF